MRGRVCEIGYINRIIDNLRTVKREQVLPLYDALRSADCIICGGSGRSLYSLNTAMSQIARIRDSKMVITPDDTGFPGRNMYDAASTLERRYKRILLMLTSGSGESEDPKTLAEDLKRYLDETGSDHFTMGLITSNPNSSIARTVREHGYVVELAGRMEKTISPEYSETGIMGDVFELGSLCLLQMMINAIFENQPVDRVYELMEEEFPFIGEIINTNVESEAYEKALDMLERRSDVFLGGRGTANEVAKMTAIRLFHIKRALGDNVYIARGVNTPRPRMGDLEILLSYSGETRTVVNWCRIFKSCGGIVLAIVGNGDSPLARNSDYQVILHEEVKSGQPRNFYMRAAFLLSPLPVKLAERLNKRGLMLPEYLLNWYHSVIQ